MRPGAGTQDGECPAGDRHRSDAGRPIGGAHRGSCRASIPCSQRFAPVRRKHQEPRAHPAPEDARYPARRAARISPFAGDDAAKVRNAGRPTGTVDWSFVAEDNRPRLAQRAGVSKDCSGTDWARPGSWTQWTQSTATTTGSRNAATGYGVKRFGWCALQESNLRPPGS